MAASDLSSVGTILDVGGGEGVLLAQLLEAYPHTSGVVLERQHTAARARRRLAQWGLLDRCEIVAGDFFSSVPPGADAYVLSFVLHNWDDERSVALLSNCREAMHDCASLYIVEQVRHATTGTPISEYLSLPTLELLSGRERTASEYGALLEAAGLRLERSTHPIVENPFTVLEARPYSVGKRR